MTPPPVDAPIAITTTAAFDVGRESAAAGTGGVLGVAGELRFAGPVAAELQARVGGYGDAHVGVDALAGLRVWILPSVQPVSFSAYALGGAALTPTPAPMAWLGLDLGLASDRPLSARIGFGAQLIGGAFEVEGGSPVAADLHAGLTWRPTRRTAAVAAPEPAAAPVAPVAPAPVAVEVAEARVVWVPHPVCAWVPITELAGEFPELSEDVSLWVTEPGFVPASLDRGHAASTPLVPAPVQGGVVVMGTPGDRVRIGATTLPITDTQAVVITAPAGPFEAVVEGGGRTTLVEGAVADGYVLWLRAAAPSPTTVRFGPNSARVDATSLATIRTLAAARGGYGFDLRGGYSSEGDRVVNEALANARAQAVRDALVAAGVPSTAVSVLPPAAPTGEANEDDRIATIVPRSQAQ
jgi:outer membrane protein OmpA-like peptidoglycan-associated protein